MMMNAPLLPRCGKIPYRTVREARQTLKQIRGQGGRYVRVYTCQTCGELHLTSRPSRAHVKKGW